MVLEALLELASSGLKSVLIFWDFFCGIELRLKQGDAQDGVEAAIAAQEMALTADYSNHLPKLTTA